MYIFKVTRSYTFFLEASINFEFDRHISVIQKSTIATNYGYFA